MIPTADDIAGGAPGVASGVAVRGWLDRRTAAQRDVIVSLVTAVVSGVSVLVAAVASDGLGVLTRAPVFVAAGSAVVGVVGRWLWGVLSTATDASGRHKRT